MITLPRKGCKTTLLTYPQSDPLIQGRNGLVFPSGSSGEHKNGTVLSTTEISSIICGKNLQPGKLRGVIFPFSGVLLGVFFELT